MTTIPAQKLEYFKENYKENVNLPYHAGIRTKFLWITSHERYHAPTPTMRLHLTVLVLYMPLNTSLVER